MKALAKQILSLVAPVQYHGARTAPVLHLTFDDGPTRHTPAVLDVLDQFAAKATFFVVGERIKGHESILRTMHQAGHAIGNHSFSHRSARTLPYAELCRDMDRCSDAIRQLLPDWRPQLFRPPYGHLTLGHLRLALQRNFRVTMWSKDPADYRASSPGDLRAALGRLSNGDIVLLHDETAVTRAALPELIREQLQNGFRFEPLAS